MPLTLPECGGIEIAEYPTPIYAFEAPRWSVRRSDAHFFSRYANPNHGLFPLQGINLVACGEKLSAMSRDLPQLHRTRMSARADVSPRVTSALADILVRCSCEIG